MNDVQIERLTQAAQELARAATANAEAQKRIVAALEALVKKAPSSLFEGVFGKP